MIDYHQTSKLINPAAMLAAGELRKASTVIGESASTADLSTDTEIQLAAGSYE